MIFINLSMLLFLFLQMSEGSKRDIPNALVYLSKYGYLAPNSMGNSSQLNAKTFKKSLADFQSFMNLPVTGKLDDATVGQMAKPRCGMKDKIGRIEGELSRFVVSGWKWRNRNLKYKIVEYSRRLDRKTVDKTIQEAFNVWSKYVDLTFEPTDGIANINIKFVRGYHGDGDPFDGPSYVLAHAYLPENGRVHFDDDERWTVNGEQGIDLLQVAVHEFGHALGLYHSEVPGAIMAPQYNGYIPNLDLFPDDINGIQRIYGTKIGHTIPPRPEVPNHPKNPELPRRGTSILRFLQQLYAAIRQLFPFLPDLTP